MSPRVLLLGLTTAAVVAVNLNAGYDANEFEIKEESTVFQMGMYPYLYLGGAQNVKPSREACEAQCLADKDCNFGTFVNQGGAALKEATHSYSTLVRYGECWLSKHTHTTNVRCGVACESFSKQPKLPSTTGAAEPTTTTTFAPRPTYTSAPCHCDPLKHPSMFTKCKQDPFSYHILVRHLQPRFHTVPYEGGERHMCKMTDSTTCKCCDCRNDGSTFDIKEIGFGIHTAKAPFLMGGGVNNVVKSFDDCRKLCHDNKLCNAGTYISAGTSEGQCWLSSYVESEQPCEKPCHSFVKATKLGEKGYDPPAEKLPLDKCEGDCDHDAHCKAGYVCHHNDGEDPVPGCEGKPLEAMDYCILDTDRFALPHSRKLPV